MSQQPFGGLLVIVFAVLATADVASARAQESRAGAQVQVTETSFLYGINLPWFDGQFGHDLGPEPQHPTYQVWYDGPKVSEYFQDINKIGFRAVRFWLMERAEGWKVDQDGIISGLDETFLRNLDDLVRRAKAEDIKLYLCLITGWNEVKYPSPFKDARQQEAYLENAVKPLTKRLKENDTIYALDIVNEIESELRDAAGPNKITVDEARTFIHKNVQAIKSIDPTRLVSAGSGYHGWETVQAGYYKGLGLDFYDIHVYNDTGYLPHVRELNVDRPVMVGEFGQGKKNHDDELQRVVVANFMHSAKEKGYAGCFVWAYGPKERFFHIVHTDGRYRPVVADIHKIITGQSIFEISN